MDHACFCMWVAFRGVPGINNVIIGAVPALCENAPKKKIVMVNRPPRCWSWETTFDKCF